MDPSGEGVSSKTLRLNGLIMLLLGGGVIWWFALRPLGQARRGAEEISVPMQIVAIGYMLLAFGILIAVFGKRVLGIFPEMRDKVGKVSPLFWLLFIALVAIGIWGWSLLNGELKELGYGADY